MDEVAFRFPDYWKSSKTYLRNAVYLSPDTHKSISGGCSKLGGLPDLPPSVDWFRRDNGRPLSFLCQINLKETAPFDTDHELPFTGMLYFFYDCSDEEDGMPWGFDFKDKDGFKVFWYDGNTDDLAPRQVPDDLDKELIFPQTALSFRNGNELPEPQSDLMADFAADDDETDDLYDYFDESDISASKLLGHSFCIQNGMELECENVTHGHNTGNGRFSIQNSEAASSWRLLLQLDSIDEANMMWGDMGILYFWIKKEDLKNRNFDKAWLILQCG